MIVSGSGTRDSPIAIDDSEDEVFNELVKVPSIGSTLPTLSPRRGTFLAELPPHLLSGEVVRDLEQFKEKLQLQAKKRKRGATPSHEDANDSCSNLPSNAARLPLEDRLSESKPESSKRAKKRRKKEREAVRAEAYIQRNKPCEVQSSHYDPSEHGRYALLPLEPRQMDPSTTSLPTYPSNMRATALLGPFDRLALTPDRSLNHSVTSHGAPHTHVLPTKGSQAASKPTRRTSLTNKSSHHPTPFTGSSPAQPSTYPTPWGNQPFPLPLAQTQPTALLPMQIDVTMGLPAVPIPTVNVATRQPLHTTLPTLPTRQPSTASHLDKHHIHQRRLPILQPVTSSLSSKPNLPQTQHQPKQAPKSPLPTTHVPIGKPDFNNKHGFFPILPNMLPDAKKPYLPNVDRTLVMEQIPKSLCNVMWITAWSQKASGVTPLRILLGIQRALIEYRSTDLAAKAWGSKRLGTDESGRQLDGRGAEYNITVYWYRRNRVEELTPLSKWGTVGSKGGEIMGVNPVHPPLNGGKEGMARLKQADKQQERSREGTASIMSEADREMWARIERSRAEKEQLKQQIRVGVEEVQKQRKVEGEVQESRVKEGNKRPEEKLGKKEQKAGQTKRKASQAKEWLEREVETNEMGERDDNERRGEEFKQSERGKQVPPAKFRQQDILRRVAISQHQKQQQLLASSLNGHPTRIAPPKDGPIQQLSPTPRYALSTRQSPPTKLPTTPKPLSSQATSPTVLHPDPRNPPLSQSSYASNRRMVLDAVLPPPPATFRHSSSPSLPVVPVSSSENVPESPSPRGDDKDIGPDQDVIPDGDLAPPNGKSVDSKTDLTKMPSHSKALSGHLDHSTEPSMPELLFGSPLPPSIPRPSFLKSSPNLLRPTSTSNAPPDARAQNLNSRLAKKQYPIPKQKALEKKLAQAREELVRRSRLEVSTDLSISSDTSTSAAGVSKRTGVASNKVQSSTGRMDVAVEEKSKLSASLFAPVSYLNLTNGSSAPTTKGSREKAPPPHLLRPQPILNSESQLVDPPAAPGANSVPSPTPSPPGTPALTCSAPQEPEKHEAGPSRSISDSSSLLNAMVQQPSPDDMEVIPVSQSNKPAVPQGIPECSVDTIQVSAQVGSAMSATGIQVQQQQQSPGPIAPRILDLAPLQTPDALRMIAKQSLAAKQKLLEEEIKATKLLMSKIAEARTRQERERLMVMLREKSRSMDEVSNSIKSEALVSTGRYSQQMKGWLRMRWPESREDAGVLIVSDDEDEADESQHH